jgi:hypothetical protein
VVFWVLCSLVVVCFELTRISLHSGRQTVQAVLFTQTSQCGRHKLYSTSLMASLGSVKLITSSTDETLADYARTRYSHAVPKIQYAVIINVGIRTIAHISTAALATSLSMPHWVNFVF